jgi:hypothetical protein
VDTGISVTGLSASMLGRAHRLDQYLYWFLSDPSFACLSLSPICRLQTAAASAALRFCLFHDMFHDVFVYRSREQQNSSLPNTTIVSR